MDVEILTHAENPSLRLCALERWAEPALAPAGWAARLAVRSGGFAAERPFYFDERGLDDFLRGLRAMDRDLRGWASLCTPYEEPRVRLEVFPSGGVLVSGVLVDDEPHAQRLAFAFRTDQTVLGPLVRDLEAARRELAAAVPAA